MYKLKRLGIFEKSYVLIHLSLVYNNDLMIFLKVSLQLPHFLWATFRQLCRTLNRLSVSKGRLEENLLIRVSMDEVVQYRSFKASSR